MRMFRSCKTLICPSQSMLQEAGQRILIDPVELCLLLNRLEFSHTQTSRFEGRVRVGSTAMIKNLATKERIKLSVVESDKANPTQGKISLASPMGSELLGLRCGDTVKLKTANGIEKWKVITVNNGS